MGDILTYDDEVLTFNGSLLSWKDIDMPFQFTIDTNNMAGTTYTLGLSSFGTYDATVDWGDDTTTTITSDTDTGKSHTYTENGIYTIKILGECTILVLSDSSIRLGLISIDNWGSTNNFNLLRFDNNTNLTSFPNFGNSLSSLTNMTSMFEGCTSLTSVDISGSNLSNVTTMFRAFLSCTSIQTLNMSNINLSSCSTVLRCFDGCNNLTDANISNIILGTSITFASFFIGCSSLINISMANTFSTGHVNNISSIFQNCSSLQEVNLSDWNVTNVTNSSGVFSSCSNLVTVNINNWDLKNVTNISSFFNSCINLENIYGYENILINNTGNVAINSFFSNCRKIEYLDLSNWSGVTLTTLDNLFSLCIELVEIVGIEDLNTSLSNTIGNCFNDCRKLEGDLDLTNWIVNNVVNMNNVFRNTYVLNSVDITGWNMSNVTNIVGMFRGSTKLTNIYGINNSTISKPTNLSGVFMECLSLTELDLSNWDVSNVTAMATTFLSAAGIFEGSTGLTSLNLSGWGDIHKSTNLRGVFQNCQSLEEIIGIDSFVNSFVVRLDNTFNNCKKLPWIDMSNWDTSNVDRFNLTFQSCESLSGFTSIENLNTENVTTMDRTFNDCISLTQLDLGNWNIESVNNFNNFLGDVPLLIDVYDNILNNFALQTPISDLTFDANLCVYSEVGELGRSILINDYNWTINDAGLYNGLYTIEQVIDLIENEDYIPVATASELNNLRNSVSQTMGSGTIWEGTYTTGVDKKYVQVRNINSSIIPRILNFSGIYDSNNLLIDVNWSVTIQESAIFQSLTSAAILRNFNVTGTINANSINFVAFICFTGNSGLIENSTVNGNIINGGTRCSLYGAGINLNNCKGFGSIECGAESGGLVAGGVNINNCYADIDITSSGNFIGVLASSGVIQVNNCETHGSITGTSTSGTFYYGGLVGLPGNGSNINNSFSTVNISAPNTTYIGGAIGRVRGIALNCYSTGSISGGGGLGGFTGLNQGTITNCYYDTNTSGQSDTGKGLPRTTLQMQQGTADSFILPAGGIDGTEDPNNAMYTNWSNNIWSFVPTNEYAILRPSIPQIYTNIFNIEQWVLNPENNFIEEFVSNLEGVTVTNGTVTEISDVNGNVVIDLPEGGNEISIYKMNEPLTTIKKTIIVDGSETYNEKLFSTLYSPNEINDLINIDGYIPVATATELNDLRNSVSQTMGSGTIWEGTYTTGLDKKYVQVDNLDLSVFATFTTIDFFAGTYDGNNLMISNFSGISLFESLLDTEIATYKNVKIEGNGIKAIFLGFANSNEGHIIVDNCHAVGNINTDIIQSGGLIGLSGSNIRLYGANITNSSFTGNITVSGTSSEIGGLIGFARSNTIVNNCFSDVTISGGTVTNSGGLIGRCLEVTLVENSYSNANITAENMAGGLIGIMDGTDNVVNKCWSNANIITTFSAGGLIGRTANVNSKVYNSYAIGELTITNILIGGLISRNINGIIQNCYASCIMNVTADSRKGGLIGQFSGTVTNSYYDTDVSGLSDTGKGLPRTTLQMQQGTADSFILPAGSIDGTEDPANAMYTNWDDTDIWYFTPDTEYPIFIPEPPYSDEDLSNLINKDGYIPVATATELDNLRNSVSQTMGSGTIWEGTYTTGLDKKYVQVDNLDLSVFADWAQLGPTIANTDLTILYDGNNLGIYNLKITSFSQGLFGTTFGAKFRNMRIYNADVSGVESNTAVLLGGQGSNSNIDNVTEIHNIIIYNSKVNPSSPSGNIGGLIGESQNEFLILSDCYVYDCEVSGTSNVGGLIGETYSEINNCGVINTQVTGTGNSIGGFCGYNRKKITNSFAENVTVINTGGSFGCGGFTGTSNDSAIFEKVWSTGTATHSGGGANGCGGLVGVLRNSSIINSYSHCNVSGVANVGGGIGQHRDATSTNCYSTGAVTGTTAVGGYAGLLTGSNTITNSYYDSDTSGQSDTGKGLLRTTLQMQQGTADSFILPAGGIDGTEDPNNAMYTNWDGLIWEFEPDDEYPKLIE